MNGLITGNSVAMTNYGASGSGSTVNVSGNGVSVGCNNCSSPPDLTDSRTFAGLASMQGSAYMSAFASSNGGGFQSFASASIDGVTTLFTLSPSAVPIPAAVWLFGSGLLGLRGFARRKKV